VICNDRGGERRDALPRGLAARPIRRGERARRQEQENKQRHGRPHRVRENLCPLFLLRSERAFGARRSENKRISPVNCIGIAIRAAVFFIPSALAIRARIANSFRPLSAATSSRCTIGRTRSSRRRSSAAIRSRCTPSSNTESMPTAWLPTRRRLPLKGRNRERGTETRTQLALGRQPRRTSFWSYLPLKHSLADPSEFVAFRSAKGYSHSTTISSIPIVAFRSAKGYSHCSNPFAERKATMGGPPVRVIPARQQRQRRPGGNRYGRPQ
jgi:hypothetical protein